MNKNIGKLLHPQPIYERLLEQGFDHITDPYERYIHGHLQGAYFKIEGILKGKRPNHQLNTSAGLVFQLSMLGEEVPLNDERGALHHLRIIRDGLEGILIDGEIPEKLVPYFKSRFPPHYELPEALKGFDKTGEKEE